MHGTGSYKGSQGHKEGQKPPVSLSIGLLFHFVVVVVVLITSLFRTSFSKEKIEEGRMAVGLCKAMSQVS